jgi:hypothetical protein
MSIQADLMIEVAASSGRIVQRCAVIVTIDDGPHGAQARLTPKQARSFLANLSALVAKMPPDNGEEDEGWQR